MPASGRFILYPEDEKRRLIVPNMLNQEGMGALLAMLFQDAQGVIAGGGNFYIGLKDINASPTDTLATITGEPSGNGYARQPVVRSAVGWPVTNLINGSGMITSLVVNFTASGGNWSTVSRLFLCSVASGVGLLFAESASFTPITVTDGQTLPAQYEFFLN